MADAERHLPRVAVVGNPNAGKTALFNALTGARQKVGNYPGVTVERKSAQITLPDGKIVEFIDLPGTYSLTPKSPDEKITQNMIAGLQQGERRPDVLLCVVDASNLRNHLKFVLELQQQGLPMVVALNMMDLAERDGIEIDLGLLETLLGCPVIATVAVRRRGLDALQQSLITRIGLPSAPPSARPSDVKALQAHTRTILRQVVKNEGIAGTATRRLDAVFLHPVIGPMILAAVLFFMFQGVFSWAETPKEWIDLGISALSETINNALPQDSWLRSLLIDGVVAGVGSVIVFLPQILILFFFIIVIEQSGYMARAAFLMDHLMARVGLNGRAFIPLLSSFACAIPGIMAARTIDNPRDRLTTILIAPLMTCSARLPVYSIIIGAFIPPHTIAGFFGLQGIVLFGLYALGILSAFLVAYVLRYTLPRTAPPAFVMELPKYQAPLLRDLVIGLYQRALLFLKRAGTIILISMLILWVFSHVPLPPEGASGPALEYSLTGKIGAVLSHVFAPIGFNREIAIALVPGMAAREVAVGALAQVYALQNTLDPTHSLTSTLQQAWSLPTALAFLAWYVFAPQCISTIAVTRRETNSWRWPAFMVAYLFVMAYSAAGITYWVARGLQ